MFTEFNYLKVCLNILCSVSVPQSGLHLTRDTETTQGPLSLDACTPFVVKTITAP